jgi:hypothetical protein
MQEPFDAAIVMSTIMRPSLAQALRSIFRQSFRGRTQIVRRQGRRRSRLPR